MKILALDIGTKNTGVAYTDETLGFPISLETIHHTSKKEFTEKVLKLVREKKIEQIVVGLPYLPSGDEGFQANIVREYAAFLEAENIDVKFVDERYTTPKKGHSKTGSPKGADPDANAAIAILNAFMAY